MSDTIMSPRELAHELQQRRTARARERAADPARVGEIVRPLSEWSYNPIPSQPVVQLSYDELRQAMYVIYQRHIPAGEVITFTERQREVVQAVIRYAIGDKTGPLSLRKGLYIHGDYGRGKTLLLRVLRDALQAAYVGIYIKDQDQRIPAANVRPYTMTTYERIVDDVQQAGKTNIIKQYTLADYCIDDLGYIEESKLNLYGTKVDLVSKIVKVMHNTYMQRRHTAQYRVYHFTSNLDPDRMTELHSEGTYSRLSEMCNIIRWDGENHRL